MTAAHASPEADAPLQISILSEFALRLVPAAGDSEANWKLAHLLSDSLRRHMPAVTLAVPTYDAVLVEFDPQLLSIDQLRAEVISVAAEMDLARPLRENPRHFYVPVLYGGSCGPDLGAVAEMTGLSVDTVIERHTAPVYTIRCLGAPGGSPMLNAPDLGMSIPRLASPRARVLQGAVSLAGHQATLTPITAPGGWRLIGRTPFSVLDLQQEPMIPYVPGDTISFCQIDEDEFDALAGRRMTAEER